jgi:hypothetical protein
MTKSGTFKASLSFIQRVLSVPLAYIYIYIYIYTTSRDGRNIALNFVADISWAQKNKKKLKYSSKNYLGPVIDIANEIFKVSIPTQLGYYLKIIKDPDKFYCFLGCWSRVKVYPLTSISVSFLNCRLPVFRHFRYWF